MGGEAAGHEHDETVNLEGLLEQLGEAGDGDDDGRVTIEAVHHAVGRRAFGPVLVIPGLMALSPVSGMPGVPTAVGIIVLLICGQLLIGRSTFWLPGFVLRRSVSKQRFEQAMRFIRPVARFVDRLIKPRLRFLAEGAAAYVIAALCLALALISPLLEAVPFAITGVGAALTAFGFALIADDGVLSLLAAASCAVTAGLVIMAW